MTRTTEETPKAIWQGEIAVMGIKLKCFVLDDGRRIIDADSMAAFLAAMADPNKQLAKDAIIEMVQFLKGGDIPEFRMCEPNNG